ncbi:MAG: hypothetical protein EOP51_18970, partial [Sphingobacteriales bacterium]
MRWFGPNDPVSFIAAATGTPAPTVKWQLNSGTGWSDISGATNNTYSFNAATAQNGNIYRAKYSNVCNDAFSNEASLTINAGPVITTHPSSNSATAGANVSFTAVATGTPTPSVQWEMSPNGSSAWNPIAGATNNTYSFLAPAGGSGDSYRAVFTNSCGNVVTNAGTLQVNNAPSITTQPTLSPVCPGGAVVLSAAATGTPTPAVQWQVSTNSGLSWTPVAGETNNTYSFNAASADNGKQYRALYSNAGGSTASSAVELQVNASPVITASPVNASDCEGELVSFSASAGGTPTPSVQWQVSTNNGTLWTSVSGATSTSYSLSAASGLSGNQYKAVFTNACGTSASAAASLTVQTPPVVTAMPSGTSATVGSVASFTAGASGLPVPTVQWQVNNGTGWSDINGATNTSYSVTTTSGDDGNTYQAVFTNTCGTVTAGPASLTLNTMPAIIADPVDQNVCVGTIAYFNAEASGSPVPSLQWQVSTNNGASWSIVPGATDATYSFTTANANNGNKYRAAFTNAAGSITSATATLTVNPLTMPTVSVAAIPAGSVCSGTPVNFTASPVNGGLLPSYQWVLNSNPVAGETNASYTLGAATDGDEVYVEMVSNASCVTPGIVTPAAPAVVTTTPTVSQPGAFTVSSSDVYMGQPSISYTVPSVSGVVYNWSYSGTGVTLIGSGNSITIDV